MKNGKFERGDAIVVIKPYVNSEKGLGDILEITEDQLKDSKVISFAGYCSKCYVNHSEEFGCVIHIDSI